MIAISMIFASVMTAQIEVKLLDTLHTGQKALVTLELNNTYDQALQGARAWVFLMDEQGKVVGQKAQWIIHPEPAEVLPQDGVAQQQPALESQQKQQYAVALDTLRPRGEDEAPFAAKVTFSRLILSDGTILHPQQAVVSAEK